jgi:hypothetical protein
MSQRWVEASLKRGEAQKSALGQACRRRIGLNVVNGRTDWGASRLGGIPAWFGLSDGGAFHFILSFVKFSFEFLAGFFELAHAFAEAASKHGELFGSEQDEDENADDNKFGGAERAESGKEGGRIHNGSHTLKTGLCNEDFHLNLAIMHLSDPATFRQSRE